MENQAKPTRAYNIPAIDDQGRPRGWGIDSRGLTFDTAPIVSRNEPDVPVVYSSGVH